MGLALDQTRVRNVSREEQHAVVHGPSRQLRPVEEHRHAISFLQNFEWFEILTITFLNLWGACIFFLLARLALYN